jgi:hypothetical protein
VSRDEQRPDYGAGARPMRQRRTTVNEWLRRERYRIAAIPNSEKRIVIPIERPERPR